MDTRQGERRKVHVHAAIAEILSNYERGVAPFAQAPSEATEALARELNAVIGALPQSCLRERLKAQVERLLCAGRPTC